MRDIVIKISDTGDVLSAGGFNALNDEMENIVESADITLDPNLGPDTDLNMLAKAFASYANAGKTYADTGSVNTYVPSLTSNLETVSQLYDGLIVIFKADNTNTGASTLAGLSFTRADGSALVADDILEDEYIIAVWNDSQSRFELEGDRRFATSDQIEAHTVDDRLVSPGNLKVVEDKFYPTGIIRGVPVDVDISNYLDCDGASYDTTTYAALFAVIGYTFGGSGANFNVPDIPILDTDWTTQSAPPEASCNGITVNSDNGDVWACNDDNVYKLTNGVGSWVDQSAPPLAWQDIAVNSSNGDVWACEFGNKIYKRTGGTGSWVDQSAQAENWRGIAVNSDNGDVWACCADKVYKLTGGTGSWVDQSAPSQIWEGIAVNSDNDDVWACSTSSGLNIYKSTGGTGSWIDQSAPDEAWQSIAVNPDNADVWACSASTNQNIYKRTSGVGTWDDQSAPGELWSGIAVNSLNGDVWACESGNLIYRQRFLLKTIIKT